MVAASAVLDAHMPWVAAPARRGHRRHGRHPPLRVNPVAQQRLICAHQFQQGVLINAVLTNPGPLHLDDDAFETELAAMVSAYLGLAPSPRRNGRTVRALLPSPHTNRRHHDPTHPLRPAAARMGAGQPRTAEAVRAISETRQRSPRMSSAPH